MQCECCFVSQTVGAADLRGHLQHQEDLQALHVNAAIQQLHCLVQVVLSGQRNQQLQKEEATLAKMSTEYLNVQYYFSL